MDRACAVLSAEDFTKDLEIEVSIDDEGVARLPRDHYVRPWFRRMVPGVAQPARRNFLSAMGRTARRLGPPDEHKGTE